MSNHTRRRPLQEPIEGPQSLFTKVEQEMADGYLEVEITGLTLRRLVCVYRVLFRSAKAYALGSVRSLVGMNPAH